MKSTVALALASFATASPVSRRADECSSPVQRKSWTSLTNDEKLTYLNAEVCLQTTPAQYGIEGAETIWDEMQYAHLRQSNYIHGVGAFLPWHRYFVTAHEKLLQRHCGYAGGVPYWEEAADAANITRSAIWDATYGVGGDGAGAGTGIAGNNSCVADGPFANLTLRFRAGDDDFSAGEPYCLDRSISASTFEQAGQSYVDACMAETDFYAAQSCFGSSVHSAGHVGTGGVMKDPVLSPGDPLFFLHHANLDRLYWAWQSADRGSRLTAVGGPNTPTAEFNEQNGWAAPGPEFTDYSGDPGNVTTPGHVLWMVGLLPNATVGDVLDLGGATVCAEYV
ncbi:hypothetical protein F4780DRAFT_235248 [Xylariomycetidae sp. FL0641]|nr:hypothetical protein F4780DRAFT_235248 [Xylariomycetidae sp. FL0641]